MFFFQKRYSFSETGILLDAEDCHSHILWGVDDGIRTKEQSIEALREMKKSGVKDLWLTPHIMEDFPNKTEDLKEKFRELCSCVKEDESPELHLGAEYMMDELFRKRLHDKDVLLTDGFLLVETSTMFAPIGLEDILQEIKSCGYYPLLAHPERYVYMGPEDYRNLYNLGINMQLNYPALAGIYGKQAQAKARWLLSKGYYKRIGSDLHRASLISRIMDEKCLKKEEILLLKHLA